jgi:hypothetical protein
MIEKNFNKSIYKSLNSIKQMKKLLLLFTAASCFCVINKASSQVVATGTTGDCTWALTGTSGNYTLTVSDSGAMQNYIYNDPPWSSYSYDITTLDIKQGVTSIGDWALYRCINLTSVTIANSVTYIGYAAFYSTGLTSINISHSVTYIGLSAFVWCPDLISINVDANNMHYSSIDGVLFNKLQDTLIQYPAGKTGSYAVPGSTVVIGEAAFTYCDGLTAISFPASVTVIGGAAFSGCENLPSITIGSSVTYIGPEAFARCYNVTSLIISNSVTYIAPFAFAECYDLASVTMGNSIKVIDDAAFISCFALPSVIIPNSVTTIGNDAFYDCSGLTSVTVGSSVTIIEHGAFSECIGLTEMYIRAQTPPDVFGADVFQNVPAGIPVYVPCGTAEAYQMAAGWDYFTDIIGDIVPALTVESNDNSKGTVDIVQSNTCTDNTAIIAATANAGCLFVQWNDGNTDNPRTVTITQEVTYTAMFDDETGITELETAMVAIYPNPVTDNIIISLRENITHAVFTLYDMQGKMLIRQTISNDKDIIPLNDLSTGLYIYNVSTATATINGKIVKQ